MSTKWVHFHEVPGILLLRLMSRCNERCLFCMVEDEIHGSDDVPFVEAIARIDSQPKETIIEFFGGEPTIYPRFLDLLQHARKRGYACSIASNCRIFHSHRFTRHVAELGAEQIYVRTSLHGPTPELHDYYTAAKGSFNQTIQGIRNIVGEGILCQVNVVIMRENVARLDEMVRVVHATGAPRIKFGNLISLATCSAHGVPLSIVRPNLIAAIDLAETLGLSVTVEKTPVCVMGGRLDLTSTERDVFGGNRIFDDDGACGACIVRKWCDGLDPDYPALFGFDGIERLDAVPTDGVRSTQTLEAPELLKTYCIGIANAIPNEEECEAIGRVLPEIERQHARLAIFPRYFLRGKNQAPQAVRA